MTPETIPPAGIWSDGTTMWVADNHDKKLYAYHVASHARDPARDFDTLDGAGNDDPWGIWSDGTTMWVADNSDRKLYAYDMNSRTRDPAREFSTLGGAGNVSPLGIWSDGTAMWVGDWFDEKLYAYDTTSKAHDPVKDFETLGDAGNSEPRGIWSDGMTMWVADYIDDKLYAYEMQIGGRPAGTATLGAPVIRSVTPGLGSITLSWSAPASDGGSSITAYDLRYIRSDAPDKADANWTVVEDAWTTGSGPLSHELTGLSGGTQYDVQIRAISGSGDGPWSAVDTATPAVQGPVSTDFNGDGRTDFVDFFLFADAYGGTDPRFDLDGNGTVDFADFFKFVDAFGA